MLKFAESVRASTVGGRGSSVEPAVADDRRPATDDPSHIVEDVLSDWNSPTEYANQPAEGGRIYSTAYYFRVVTLLEKMARVIGRDEEATRLAAWGAAIAATFDETFFERALNRYRGHRDPSYRQAMDAVALSFDLVPAERIDATVARLVEDVTKRCHGHLNTGLVGTVELMHALPRFGQSQVAFNIASKRSYPSWGHMLDNNRGTTIWEDWGGHASRNHPMLGCVGAFFYDTLAGIRPIETTPAFEEFHLTPAIVDGLDYVECTYDSVRGQIAVTWKRDGDRVAFDLTVPGNTVAHFAAYLKQQALGARVLTSGRHEFEITIAE